MVDIRGSADGRTLRLSMPQRTAELSLATSAAPSVSHSSPGGAAPPLSSTAYDGTYSGELRAGGGVGSSRIAVLLQVTNGRGAGTLTMPGCSPSQFSLAVQPAGKVSGEGNFNCFAGHSSGTNFIGPIKIDGTHADKSLRLSFVSERGQKSDTVLTLGAAASPGLPSPDGLWRGTYKCEASLGANAYSTAAFTLPLDIRLAGGSGTWKNNSPAASDGFTLEIQVSVDGNAVRFSRYYLSQGTGMSTPATLSGQYDGNAIGATGREMTTPSRQCTLALTRA